MAKRVLIWILLPMKEGIDLTFALGADNPITFEHNEIRLKMQRCLINSIGALAGEAWLSIVRKKVFGSHSASEYQKASGGKSLTGKNTLHGAWRSGQSKWCESMLHLDDWAVQDVQAP